MRFRFRPSFYKSRETRTGSNYQAWNRNNWWNILTGDLWRAHKTAGDLLPVFPLYLLWISLGLESCIDLCIKNDARCAARKIFPYRCQRSMLKTPYILRIINLYLRKLRFCLRISSNIYHRNFQQTFRYLLKIIFDIKSRWELLPISDWLIENGSKIGSKFFSHMFTIIYLAELSQEFF